MPTAEHYDDAAGRYLALAARLTDEIALAPRHATFVGAGRVRDVIETTTQHGIGSLRTAVEDLLRLAAVCERRAEICRRFRLQLRRYDELPESIRVDVARPSRPYPWVRG
jgi:hypothetical protein